MTVLTRHEQWCCSSTSCHIHIHRCRCHAMLHHIQQQVQYFQMSATRCLYHNTRLVDQVTQPFLLQNILSLELDLLIFSSFLELPPTCILVGTYVVVGIPYHSQYTLLVSWLLKMIRHSKTLYIYTVYIYI